jgi:hypothetical protein
VHIAAISTTTKADADAIVRNNIRLYIDLWMFCAGKHLRLRLGWGLRPGRAVGASRLDRAIRSLERRFGCARSFLDKARKGQAGPRGRRMSLARNQGSRFRGLTEARLLREICRASAMRLPRKRKISNSAVFDAGREPRQDSAPWGGAGFAIRSTRRRSSGG